MREDKKIATITFHSSHNHGSNLQAYALQEYIKKIGNESGIIIDYKIINLRNKKLKEINSILNFKGISLKKIIKNIFNIFYYKKLKQKYENFEKFINSNLNITKEYTSLEELRKEEFNYEYYISGSDQLWNLSAYDFDWANYLEFVKKGKKISYAASFGPKAQVWNDEEKDRVRRNLLSYNELSVREQGSYDNVYKLTGKKAQIHVDPTMLLDKQDWFNIIPQNRIVEKKYILFYTLNPNKEVMKIVKEISKKLELPVVITKFNNKYDVINGFEKEYGTGPIEFLNLLKNSEIVLSTSFHGTVFSVLFNKPFFAINGAKDFRISNLLKKMSLENRTVEMDNIEEKCKNAFNIDFSESEKLLNEEREKSRKYLIKALEIEE